MAVSCLASPVSDTSISQNIGSLILCYQTDGQFQEQHTGVMSSFACSGKGSAVRRCVTVCRERSRLYREPARPRWHEVRLTSCHSWPAIQHASSKSTYWKYPFDRFTVVYPKQTQNQHHQNRNGRVEISSSKIRYKFVYLVWKQWNVAFWQRQGAGCHDWFTHDMGKARVGRCTTVLQRASCAGEDAQQATEMHQTFTDWGSDVSSRTVLPDGMGGAVRRLRSDAFRGPSILVCGLWVDSADATTCPRRYVSWDGEL